MKKEVVKTLLDSSNKVKNSLTFFDNIEQLQIVACSVMFVAVAALVSVLGVIFHNLP